MAGPWHWICQEGCGAVWAEEVTCVVAGWFLPVTGAVLCTGGEAATEGGCSGHAGEAPSFQLGHRWMTHLLAAPRPAYPSETAWQAPPFSRRQSPGQPQASLLKLGGSGKDILQSLLRTHDPCLGLSSSGSHGWQKHILVATSAAFLNVVLRSVLQSP